MAVFRRKSSSHVRDVIKTCEDAQRLHGQGRLDEAIRRIQVGCDMVREVLQDDPSDLSSARQLGAMLYMLGEWQFEGKEAMAAIASLEEAERSYEKLGDPNAIEIADVVIRRARIRSDIDMPLSALADAQQAAIAALVGSKSSGDLAAARVIAIAGHVEWSIGADPDLALTASTVAWDTFRRRLAADGVSSFPEDYLFAVKCAVDVTAIVETARGRAEEARSARDLATAFRGGAWPEFDELVDQTRTAQPTLAEVLREAGRNDLMESLARPGDPMVPGLRCNVQLAPQHAAELAELALADGLTAPARMLLLLEAHALFAHASRNQVPGMRYQFGDHGPAWADAVLHAGRLAAAQDCELAAYDAISWLTGLKAKLMPVIPVSANAGEVVAEATRWTRDMFALDGKADTAATLTAYLRGLGIQPEPADVAAKLAQEHGWTWVPPDGESINEHAIGSPAGDLKGDYRGREVVVTLYSKLTMCFLVLPSGRMPDVTIRMAGDDPGDISYEDDAEFGQRLMTAPAVAAVRANHLPHLVISDRVVGTAVGRALGAAEIIGKLDGLAAVLTALPGEVLREFDVDRAS